MDASSSPCHHLVTKRATYVARDSKGYHEAGKSRSKSVDSPNARFACHFLLANPRKIEANAICARTTWPSIPRLKEHLYRRHGQERPSCPRCAKTFEKQKDLEEHQRAAKPCQILNPSDRPSRSISPAQMYSLRRRKGQYNGSEVNKWFEIWDLIFPEKQRPRTPSSGWSADELGDTVFVEDWSLPNQHDWKQNLLLMTIDPDLDQNASEGKQTECEADCSSDLDSHEGICAWNFGVMDDFQKFIEQRVSTAMFDKLQRSHLLKEREDGHENIKSLIRDCVDSAFKEYKKPVDNQLERVTGLHEEPEEISEPQDVIEPHISSGIHLEGDTATDLTTSPITSLNSTLSPSDSIFSTATRQLTDESMNSDWFSLDGDPFMPNLSCYKSMMDFFESEERNYIQEPLMLPPATDLQSCNHQMWAVGPELYGYEPRDEYLKALGGDSIGHGLESI